MFLLLLLGVQKQTTNIGVLLELGQTPLTLLAQKNSISNLARIITRTKCNENVVNSFETAALEKLTWTTRIENTLAEIGMRQEFIGKDENTPSKAFQRIKDIFHRGALSDIRREENKLRTYSLFKTSLGYEQYLSEIQNVEQRTALTKLRLSNHQLMIEKGRHIGVEKDSRFCPFCPNKIENEKHFLMECNPFSTLRNELFQKSRKVLFLDLYSCKTEQFITLVNKYSISGITAEYVFRALDLRDFLLSKPKAQD